MGDGLVRINLGSGPDRKPGWINVDNGVDDDIWTERPRGDVVEAECFDYLASLDDASADEVYAGHFLEHWDYEEGQRLLREIHRVLKPCGIVGIVVPDTKEVLRQYFFEGRDLDDLCEGFLYSTIQPSRHKWSYDLTTLRRALERAGFTVTDEIDRYGDPRLAAGAWFQCGLEGVK